MIRPLSSSRISQVVDGSLVKTESDREILYVTVDSRNLIQPESTLFVALTGAKYDGHDFIDKVYEAGVRYFLVKKDKESIEIGKYKNGNFIWVDEPLSALQKLAAFQRRLFEEPVVGITGSNGKTIVKEWLAQILGQQLAVAKSPKSYNSQVGVPLSLFGIASYHKVAVIEAGISTTKEMEALASMIQPDFGIFTNIGTAHEDGFVSQEEKLAEKLKLFEKSKRIIYCKDHRFLADYLESHCRKEQLISWSGQSGADFTLSVKKSANDSQLFLIKPDLEVFTFKVPFTDEASLENIRHAITVAVILGIDLIAIQEGIKHLRPVEMRLTLKSGSNGSLLIDDTYNNDLAGLRLALEFMAAQRPKKRKILFLSDMLQVGDAKAVYQEVNILIRQHQIDYVFGVGNEIRVLEKEFPQNSKFFPNTESLLAELDPDQFDNDLILITGARNFGFEGIVQKLQQRLHGTVLEINLNALTHNYNFFKSRLKPKTKVMVMVKAFAYGGGSIEIANHLQQLQADYLAVAYADEGVILREQGITLPIMVLNPMEESFDHLQKFNLEPVVYSPYFYRQIGKFCRSLGYQMRIHVDLDTGMHRLGFEEKHLDELEELIKAFPALRVASLYTHLAGADEKEHQEYSLFQLGIFEKMCERITSQLAEKPMRHALNSAGIIRYPESQMDMVRLGIGLYGVEATGTADHRLQTISTLKTSVSQIKYLKKGQTVGYSRRGELTKDSKIATLAIGYADGYDRRFSNGKGYVKINGQTAPIIGNVCMDMCMVDISDIEVKEGDEAVIYGDGISLKDLATRIGTIPYELLTNISSRVKRVYYLD